MVCLDPRALLKAGAGGLVAYGAVTVGFAIIGFFAGSWATRRKHLRHKKTCMPTSRGICQPLLRHQCDDQESHLLEYGYDGVPLPPKDHSPRPGPLQIPGVAPGTSEPATPAASYNEQRAKTALKLALQAYKRPADGEGYRTRNIRGLPTVTFFDKDLLTKTFSGVLHVHVHGAHNLRAATLKGSASPYVEVFVASSSFRTETAMKTLEPVWNEDRWLYIRDPNYDALCVRVVDGAHSTEGEDMGVAVLGLGGLVHSPGNELTFKLPLRGYAGECSTVTLVCRYLKFTDSEGPDSIPELMAPLCDEAISTATPAKLDDLGDGAQRPVAYIDCGLTDTQAWLFSDPEKRQMTIAFRGTEQSQLKDIITDARLMPCAFKTIIETHRTGNINVHRGFMRAYRSVRRLLSSLLHIISEAGACHHSDHSETDSEPEAEDWEVLVTGHSLGGALATLAAYELALYRQYAGCIKSVSLYTYGSPRVGNDAFARDFDRLVPDAWRFTNGLDLVTSIPPSGYFFRYRHVGHPVRLRDGGVLLKGLNHLEIDEPHNQELRKAKVQKDVMWLRALISLKGLAEHSGDLYTSRLQAAKGN